MKTLRIFIKTRIFNASYIIISLTKMLVSSVYPFVNIIIPRLIIDELLTDRNITKLVVFVSLIVGINFAYKIIISFIDAFIQKQASVVNMKFGFVISEISMGLPYEILEKDEMIQLLKQAKEGKNRSGGITSLVDSFFFMAANVITVLGITALIASLDFWLILIAIATIIINTWVQSKLKESDIAFFNNLMKLNTKFMYHSTVILNRRFAKDIRLFEANRIFTEKMNDFTMEADKSFKRTGRIHMKYAIPSYFTDCISQAFIYGYLAVQFLGGIITIGLFTMYVSAVTTFTNTVVETMKNIMDINEKYKWLKPAFDFMEYHSKKYENDEDCVIKNIKQPIVEFRNVSYRYENSDIYALKNVSLVIPYGQKLSVVGMNGAGKTTLIKLLLRLYTPTDGAIFINGCDINKCSLDDYYRLFSVVFQDFKLLATTVRENIICNEIITEKDEHMEGSLIKTGMYERIKKMPLKYETEIYKLFDSEGIDLSGGEEQRLAISRALYKNAPIVVLDEPTSALDPKTEYEIYTSMDKLVENKTSIYISHRMTSCIFCDMVAVFHEGKLIQYGNHKQLIKQDDMYAQMFNAQAQYYL